MGRFPQGTMAVIREFGCDSNRIQCEFPTQNGVIGWISIFDQKLGKPLLKCLELQVEQGQRPTDGRLDPTSAWQQAEFSSAEPHPSSEYLASTDGSRERDACFGIVQNVENRIERPSTGTDASTSTPDGMEVQSCGWHSEEEV